MLIKLLKVLREMPILNIFDFLGYKSKIQMGIATISRQEFKLDMYIAISLDDFNDIVKKTRHTTATWTKIIPTTLGIQFLDYRRDRKRGALLEFPSLTNKLECTWGTLLLEGFNDASWGGYDTQWNDDRKVIFIWGGEGVLTKAIRGHLHDHGTQIMVEQYRRLFPYHSTAPMWTLDAP